MAMHVMRIAELPLAALEAAATAYRDIMPQLAAEFARHRCIVLQLPHAPYDHDDWRRGFARDVARAYAPGRFNVVSGGDPDTLRATLDYLTGAEGVTGQLLRIRTS